MPSNPLFSTYRTGENRVTSSIMAVFERLDLALVRDVLAAAAGAGDELRAVTFQNQIVGEGSVPDARITGRFTWWFETKTARGSYAGAGHDRDQLRGHARLLENEPDATLFVVTPDPVRPAWFDGFGGSIESAVAARIIWLSFRQLSAAIEELVSDPGRLLGEQTRFLLSELVQLFETDGLLTNDDTVIVAARSAWPFYKETAAYVCQPNRAFRDGLTHLGFYSDGAVQPLVPRIIRHIPTMSFTMEEAERRAGDGEATVAESIETALKNGTRVEGEAYVVFLLSDAEAADTVKLASPIVNDTKTASGKTWAWTLGQRYTSLERLTSGVTVTSGL